ncbi:NUDIX domain-containing protein [Rhizobium wenxiniae]|uniref:NUDIX domain-containing protein n=1 Tax=Rhizobium wenxiniae TaxID=1737357 RepID=UPI003C2A6299
MKKWDLAGGHVEKGEGLDVALVRECQEEVGLTPRAFDHVATLYEDDDPEKNLPSTFSGCGYRMGVLRASSEKSIRSSAGLRLTTSYLCYQSGAPHCMNAKCGVLSTPRTAGALRRPSNPMHTRPQWFCRRYHRDFRG